MPSWVPSSTTRGSRGRRDLLLAVYETLLAAYGPQGWWPGATPFEIVVGAILTQRAAWANVERAIAALRQEGLLEPEPLRRASARRVASLIRPAVYYNEKAKKLRAFLSLLHDDFGGDLRRLLELPPGELRGVLLSVRGIGEETADAILLYAAGKPSFVVDAYTRRILSRLGLMKKHATYAQARAFFMDVLPHDSRLYNEYHALLVKHGKERCRLSRPVCSGCPLGRHCTNEEIRR